MTQDEAKKLPLGLYHVYWKTGGQSLASVGQLHDGKRWFAPANWTNTSPSAIACVDWRMVERVAKILTISEADIQHWS